MKNSYIYKLSCLVFILSTPIYAEEYHYNSIGKVDPFQSLAAAQNAVFGTSGRLQKYELSELSLVGTAIGKDSTALIMTPLPIEGFLVRVGDALGKRGGKIVSLTKKELIVREFADGTAGSKLKSTLVVMNLSAKMTELKDKASATDRPKFEELNFSSLSTESEIQPEKSGSSTPLAETRRSDFAIQTTPTPINPTPAEQSIAAPKLSDVPAPAFKGINP